MSALMLVVWVATSHGAVPDAAHSTCPAAATVSPNGSACFDVTVRDGTSTPIAGSSVSVDFGGCAISFCPSQTHAGNLVTLGTNANGVAHFCICGIVTGACTVSITADGVPLCTPPAQSCGTQIPQTMSYQGVLTDNTGTIVPDGTYNLTFKLYDDPTLSGSHGLWTETHNATQITRGGFTALLGAIVPLTLAFDKPYYLGITISAGTELQPRVTLAASPYSLNARSVADCAVTGNAIALGQVVKSLNGLHDAVTLAPGANVTLTPSGQTITISASGGGGGVSGSGSANSVAKFTGSTSLGNSSLFDNGNVGVGTSSPDTRLTIDGDAHCLGTLFFENGPSDPNYYLSAYPEPGSAGMRLNGYGGVRLSTGQGDMVNVENNLVGIATTSPGATLDVNGNIIERSPTFIPDCYLQPLYRHSLTGEIGVAGGVCAMSPPTVTPLSNAADVLHLNAVKFAWKDAGAEDVGLVADDVSRSLRELVLVGKDGKPEGVKYDRLALYLLEVVKQQQHAIERLEAKLDRLNAK